MLKSLDLPDEFKQNVIAQNRRRNNDEDGSLTVSKPVAWRDKSTMAAIHPPNDNRADKLVTKRLSDADKKEIARSASSRLTLPRYLCGL